MKDSFTLLFSGLLVLSASALLNPNTFVYDERLFPPNVVLMEQVGFGKQFLLEMKDQSPGPLYEFIHLPLRSITKLEPPGLRTVNLFLFYLVIAAMTLFFSHFNNDTMYVSNDSLYNSLYTSLHIVAVPTLWQVAGLALTEIPAMFFALVSFYLCCALIRSQRKFSSSKIILLSTLAGIAAGLAILGRTVYLVLATSFLATVLLDKFLHRTSSAVKTFLPFVIVLLLMTLPVFFVWKGLVPPLQPDVEGEIKPWHGLLAMAYACIIGFVINPYWFVIDKKLIVGVILTFIAFYILNFFGLGYKYDPLSATLEKFFGTQFVIIFSSLASPALATLGIYFLVCCFYKAKEKLHDPIYIFALLSALAVLATAAKISHLFSSRYVAQAAPFLVIIFTDLKRDDPTRSLRLAIGMIIGFLSLNTYAKLI